MTSPPPEIADKLRMAFGLQQAGRLIEAEAAFRDVLHHDPRQFDALHLLGVIAVQRGALAEAAAFITRAIAVDGNHAGAHYNLGYVLEDLRRYPEAVASYDRALALAPENVVAYNNRGVALSAARFFEAAVISFDQALTRAPDYAEAHYNRGLALSELGRHEEAIAGFEQALRHQPGHPYLQGTLLYTKMRICDWAGAAPQIALMAEALARREKVSSPWPVLSLIDSPMLQRAAAEVWADDKHPPTPAQPRRPRVPGKIRLGYFSADFRAHPVAALAAGLFESHDRALFDVTAFSIGPNTDDAMRKRLEKAFDHFIDVQAQADAAVAAMARDMHIDIAVDLGGYTTDSRAGIFSARAAPLQVGFLGYPGTMGSVHFDYLVADAVVVPAHHLPAYREHIVHLPCFQPNDRSRPISTRDVTRKEAFLPEQGVVFCCFNNAYKITPDVFAGWMRILQRVAGSVLWLSAHNTSATANLRRAAETHGVDPARLVFAAHVSAPEHFARHRAADLFLDTFPYNAHTTASDALWAGLPVLTRAGESYAARVSASLLTALGLEELVTTTPDAYESLAIALALDPSRLQGLRKDLGQRLAASSLFDIAAYTRGLEEAYRRILARHQDGMPPDHIYVDRAGLV